MLFYPPNRSGTSISIIFLAMIIALVADMYCSATPVPADHLATYPTLVGHMDYDPPQQSLQAISAYSSYYAKCQSYRIDPRIFVKLDLAFYKVVRATLTKLDHALASCLSLRPGGTPHVSNVDDDPDQFFMAFAMRVELNRSSKLVLTGFLIVQPGSSVGTGSAVFHYCVAKTGEDTKCGTLELEDDLANEFWKLLAPRYDAHYHALTSGRR
ncbi:hypothetical protein FB446DRAFT_743594 [Lentinula raphanica]|nr:hypothetical protein FB446DRAFT_743594 [Lentinula raphanica]